jgi:hypothetical protein
MANFLTTSGTNYHLEDFIRGASDRLILISTFLKLNDRMKELLVNKNLNGYRGKVLSFSRHENR